MMERAHSFRSPQTSNLIDYRHRRFDLLGGASESRLDQQRDPDIALPSKKIIDDVYDSPPRKISSSFSEGRKDRLILKYIFNLFEMCLIKKIRA